MPKKTLFFTDFMANYSFKVVLISTLGISWTPDFTLIIKPRHHCQGLLRRRTKEKEQYLKYLINT